MMEMEYDRDDVFEYLVKLRDSGITNMFGAAPYVANAFGISKKEASRVLVEWMKSFNG